MGESVRGRLKGCRSMLTKYADLSHLLPYLNSIDPSKLGIKVEKNVSKEELNKALIDYVQHNPSQGVMQAFLDALKQAGMDPLHDYLARQKVIDEPIFSELIERNDSTMRLVDWDAVLTYYYDHRLIETIHKNHLESLLKRMEWPSIICYISFKENWFFELIKCLKSLKENRAVNSLSHLLYIADSDASIEGAIQILFKENEGMQKEVQSTLEKSNEDMEAFCKYIKLFGRALYNVDVCPIFDYLYQERLISYSTKNNTSNIKSQFHKVLYMLCKIKEFDGLHFIKALQSCKETEALKALDFEPGDDDKIIKSKLEQIKVQDQKFRMNPKVQNLIDRSPSQPCKDEKIRGANVGGDVGWGATGGNPHEDGAFGGGATGSRPSYQNESDLQVDAVTVKEAPTLQLETDSNLPSVLNSGKPKASSHSINEIISIPLTISYDFRSDDELRQTSMERGKRSINGTKPIMNMLKLRGHGRRLTEEDICESLETFYDYIKDDPTNNKFRKCIQTTPDGTVVIETLSEECANYFMDVYGSMFDISYLEETIIIEDGCNDGGEMLPPREQCIQRDYAKQNALADRNSKFSQKNKLQQDDAYRSETSHISFELRNYQKELAEPATTGANCIIVAPTGSGKTHVAIFIIKKHFERDKKNKVVFTVPTVALVEQQKKQVQTYCPDQRVYGMSGSSDISLEHLINRQDVFVLTPQILVNQLRNDINLLTMLTLIIFDECHHTNKDHAYNSIMADYLSIKHTNRNATLPQIVGLTASIGVGKSKNTMDAIKHVKTICANLDSPTVCTVSKHSAELERYVNKPAEETLEIHGRKVDQFDHHVNAIMSEIEKRMVESPEKENAEKEIKNFGKDIKTPPSERGNDPYTQWLSRIRKCVCTIHKQDTRMFYITIIDYLIMYNNSLMINADCRTKDAISYIENKIANENYESLPLPNGLNEILVQQWRDNSAHLKRISDDPECNNPKLEKIKSLICKCYSENFDSRVILFCKTREMASALVNWMNETEELRQLNPTKLVGTNAPANREGMTSVQQDDVLKYFKNGEHKIIIATSVAEEGLDVQKCNMVIRYEHVTSSISRVQTRGRARKDHAKYILVAEKGRGAAEKEEKNAIREEMMKRAIIQFQSLGFQERKNSIYDLQKESLINRKLTECGKKVSMNLKEKYKNEEEFELRCLKCDQFAAMSPDIRKIEESHHVIIDPQVKDRIEIRPHPKSKQLCINFEKTGKIHCAKCKLEWGIMALYKKAPFPVIKISSFIVKSGSSQSTYKQWKAAPFSVMTLTAEDLEEAASAHIFPQHESQWNELSYIDTDSSSD